MLTEKQIKEVREHLNSSQSPLFFFDNDCDGLCSFLLLARSVGKGKGVAIKSFPELDESYTRKINELRPDCVFILDKAVVSEDFLKRVKEMNLPIVWIDHHESSELGINSENVYYYNPQNQKKDKKSSEPVSYWAWKIANKKEDIWLAMTGCVGDTFLPDFKEEFKKEYPDLWDSVENANEAMYQTEIGKLSRVFDFALKDRTSKVVRMIKKLLKVRNPREILDEDSKNEILKRFNQIEKKYRKLIDKAKLNAGKDKVLFFQYGGSMSLSSDISNELHYLFPEKIIVVAYLKGAKANISLRGERVDKITEKAIEGLDNATGGGHEKATGAKVQIEDLEEFKKRVEGLCK